MIKLDDIKITEETIYDEDETMPLYKAYYARLILQAIERVNWQVKDEVPEYWIKEKLQHNIMHHLYGDFRKDVYELLYIAKSIKPDPSYPMLDEYIALDKIEQRIRARLG